MTATTTYGTWQDTRSAAVRSLLSEADLLDRFIVQYPGSPGVCTAEGESVEFWIETYYSYIRDQYKSHLIKKSVPNS